MQKVFSMKQHLLLLLLLRQSLTVYPRLALNSQRSSCLCLLRAGSKGVCHCAWFQCNFLKLKNSVFRKYLDLVGPGEGETVAILRDVDWQGAEEVSKP